MKLRNRNLWFAIVALLLIGFTFAASYFSAPNRLRRQVRFNAAAKSEVEVIVQRYGTKAVPVLVDWIDEAGRPESAYKRWAEKAIVACGINSPRFWAWYFNSDSAVLAECAIVGLSALGPAGETAIPRLAQIRNNVFAVEALSRLQFERSIR